jgi:CheY-like chemotaxis protein
MNRASPEKRILIVEDERIVAEDLKRLLERMGYAVSGVAASGEEALRNVRASRPDLVLMDISIEGPMDGIEVARRLRAEYGVPISYLSAHADIPTIERAKDTMPFGYISKPFEAQTLQIVIELAINRHKTAVVLREASGLQNGPLIRLTDELVGAAGLG